MAPPWPFANPWVVLMPEWGFTNKGFLPKPFDVIAQEIKDDWLLPGKTRRSSPEGREEADDLPEVNHIPDIAECQSEKSEKTKKIKVKVLVYQGIFLTGAHYHFIFRRKKEKKRKQRKRKRRKIVTSWRSS